MGHLEVLREKIGRLRLEIAEIQEENEQYRREGLNETDAEVAHCQRLERLQAIQQELAQLAALGPEGSVSRRDEGEASVPAASREESLVVRAFTQ
jgi:hypothetical protein